MLGIDLGIENIATDSDGQVFSGEKVEQVRKRYNKLRAGLQRVTATSRHRSAQRKLKKMSGREKRFKRDVNHVISKAIVSKSKGTLRAVALEDLGGIRRATVRHTQRDRHSKWSFGQLRAFVEYKAKRDGVPVRVVDPRNTSRECAECHNIDARKVGLSRSTFYDLKKKFAEGKAFTVSKKTIRKLRDFLLYSL